MKGFFAKVQQQMGGGKEQGIFGKVIRIGEHYVKAEEKLGEGGFATIYRVKEEATGQVYAVKHFRLDGSPETRTAVREEARIMTKLRNHPNVLRLHAVAFAGEKNAETDGFFLMDLCPSTLSDRLLAVQYAMDEQEIVEVFAAVVSAVHHMHSLATPICHRDIKSENVLFTASGGCVLCDYGSATTRAKVYQTLEEIGVEEYNIQRTTTPAYRAPEMWDLYRRQYIGPPADVWALGCLLYLLMFGRLPFDGLSGLQVLNSSFDIPNTRSPELTTLLRDMMVQDPQQRPNAEQIGARLQALGASVTQAAPAAKGSAAVAPNTGAQGTHTPNTSPPPSITELMAQATPQAAAPGSNAARPAPSKAAIGSFWAMQDTPQESGAAAFGTSGMGDSGAAAAASSGPKDGFADFADFSTFNVDQPAEQDVAPKPLPTPAQKPAQVEAQQARPKQETRRPSPPQMAFPPKMKAVQSPAPTHTMATRAASQPPSVISTATNELSQGLKREVERLQQQVARLTAKAAKQEAMISQQQQYIRMLQDENAALKTGTSEAVFEPPAVTSQPTQAAGPPPLISIMSGDPVVPQPPNGALVGNADELEEYDLGVDGFGDGEFVAQGQRYEEPTLNNLRDPPMAHKQAGGETGFAGSFWATHAE